MNLLLSRLVPMQMKRRGVEMRIVLECDSTPNRVDLPLLKAVARARGWADDLGACPSNRIFRILATTPNVNGCYRRQ